MLGLDVKPHDIFWGEFASLRKRQISIEYNYWLHCFKQTCNKIDTYYEDNSHNKVIYITSTAKKALLLQNKLDLYLVQYDNICGDIVDVVGSQNTKLKNAYTTEFTNTEFKTPEGF